MLTRFQNRSSLRHSIEVNHFGSVLLVSITERNFPYLIESIIQESVPKGEVSEFQWNRSKVFPETIR
jgi:hypothetical protein